VYDKCPKCGTPRPKPGDMYGTHPCVAWVPPRLGFRQFPRPCSCMKEYGFLHRVIFGGSYHPDPKCNLCDGTGWITKELIPDVPEALRYTCPGCGFAWNEPVKDAEK
jgi:hypothetical protein